MHWIKEFHSQPPHSRKRKDIIENTLKALRPLCVEPNYWNFKRVRTWFWNHRADEGVTIDRKEFKSNKNKNREESSPTQHDENSPESHSSPEINEKKQKSPKIIKEKIIQDNNQIQVINEKNSNSPQPTQPTCRNSVAQAQFSTPITPISSSDLRYASNKTWKIYASQTMGPDKNHKERWLNSTTGRISLNWCSITGQVSWRHDEEYNTFKGKLSITKRNEPPKWTEYVMNGIIGSSLMDQLNLGKNNNFHCSIRRILSSQVQDYNEKLKKQLKDDIGKFGADQFNDKNKWKQLKIYEDDIEAKFHFYTLHGKHCGVRVFARRLDTVVETCYWRPSSSNELLLALQMVRIQLQAVKDQQMELVTPSSSSISNDTSISNVTKESPKIDTNTSSTINSTVVNEEKLINHTAPILHQDNSKNCEKLPDDMEISTEDPMED